MVQEVACKKQSQLQKEYLDQLPLAKERVKNYPILNKYFDNFRSYEDKSYYENSVNIIFKTCIKRPQAFWTPSDSITVLVDSPFFPILLDELETAINHFKIDNMWSIKEKNDLFSRLTSPDPHISSVVISEILIPYRIDNKIGPNKVKIQSKISSGRRPDNLLDIGNGRQIFLELTSLKPRISEKKIKKICNDLAKYLNNKCKKNNYTIFVHFDTRVLIPLAEPNGHIDELVAKQFLREWADRLLLHELPCSEGSIHFNNNTNTEQSGFLIDIFNDELSTISLPSELCKMITHQDSVRDWAKRVTISDYINSPFETVTYRKATNNECVVVDTVDFDSTSELLQDDKSMVASKAIKKAFKDQVARTINYKIGLQQYVEGTPVIFGINAFEWRYMFEHDYDEYVELRDTIRNMIKKTNWLSGVIIYYSDFYNGRYIENGNAANKIRVTDKELQNLGIIKEYNDPIITHDRKIDLSVFNRDEQIQKLENLVEKEFTLRLREDKLELLEHIASLLLNKELPVSLISKIQPIIIKYCNSSDPSSESTSLKTNTPELGIFSYPTLRSNASACQLRITWHIPTMENKNLCLRMLKDENTLVREEACKNLSFFAAADYQQSLEIARKILEDNWRVRFYLTDYLCYLARNQKPELLDLCREIICKFGKTEKQNGQGENALLKFVISIIVVKSLSEGVSEYKKLLDELLEEPYNHEVKNEIAFQCKREEIIKDDNQFNSVIPIFLRLAEHDSETVRNKAIFLVFHSLVSINKSRLPNIKPFLDISAKQKYEYQGVVHTNFQFLRYLDKFWEQFPQECAMYFLIVFSNNPNPEMYIGYSNIIVNLLKNLLTSKEVSDKTKIDLRIIINTLRKANSNFVSLLKDLE